MDDSVKIKKNYKLMGTESDPVIIAQRLLNLYRQLHIFSPEKKDAYNKMLLEQSPEVKRMLGSLPGGIVVQQYINDIEEEIGLDIENFDNPDIGDNEPNHGHKDSSKGRGQASGVSNDPEMIKGIVEAFKEAIVTSEKNRKEDTKELAQTIVALQSKLNQTMISGKGGVPESGLNLIGAPRIDEIVAGISRAQAELIKEMAQAQTQELSQLISQVLKEIQQMSTQTLIDAVQTVHRENMDFFKNQIFSSVSMVPMTANMAEIKEQDEEAGDDKAEESNNSNFSEQNSVPLETFSDENTNIDNAIGQAPSSEEENINEETMLNLQEEYEEGEYEWEYIDEETGESIEAVEEIASDEEYEDGEFVWEYVEDDGSEDNFEEYQTLDDNMPNNIANEDVVEEKKEETDTLIDLDAFDDTNNSLLSHNDNFSAQEEPIYSISLDDSFGLSSNDDITELPR